MFVWVMMGIAIWHGCVLVPDRFYGGLIGAFAAAVTGAVASGYLLPLPGCGLALLALYVYGTVKERRRGLA